MSHTYTSAWFHLVFATKGREPSIVEPPKLRAYLAGIACSLLTLLASIKNEAR